MKILIYGECNEYGSGAWSYSNTLQQMGHEVDFYHPYEKLNKYLSSVFYKIIRKARKGLVLNTDRKRHIEAFIKKAEIDKPQIIIILKGVFVDRVTVQKLKALGSWVVVINHDDYFSLFSYQRSNMQLKAVPFYDYVFCTKEVNVNELRELNANIEMLMFAYDPSIHFPPDYNEANKCYWETDIVFVGSRYKEREKQLAFLVSNSSHPVNLKIYGSNWNKLPESSVLYPYIQDKYLVPDEMRSAIFYSKITLGFLCKENRDDYTQRSFEIPACKGLFLGERTARHLSFYKEGEDAMFFDSNNYRELLEKVQYLLANPEAGKLIRDSGFNKVHELKCTYKDRMERLIDLYNKRPA